jgi:hypothetical protein
MRPGKLLWLFALLPLVLVSAGAQEPAAQEPVPEQPPAAATEPPAEDKPEPASPPAPEPVEEQVSADNNLSFPVDI